MAGLAKKAEIEDLDEWDPVQLTAARLFAQGKSRHHVARALRPHLLTKYELTKPVVRHHARAMRKLRRWQQSKAFRDLVWQFTLDRLDSRTPEIVDGVTDRAANGRVDAAKLALELSGRYSPKGHDQPTAVQIVVNGVPRPMATHVQDEIVEGTVVSEEDMA